MLTNEQENAVKSIIDDYYDGATASTLSGSPGTGKTHTTGEAVREFRKMDLKIAVTASTNKALDVIQQAALSGGWYHHVAWWGTVHKILGLVYVPEEDRIRSYSSGVVSKFNVVVVDEASMLNAEILALLRSKANFVLFVGDRNQLPPVGEEIPIAFMVKGPDLKTSMRHDNPDIRTLVEYMKLAIEEDYMTVPAKLLEPFAIHDFQEWQDGIGIEDNEMALAYTNAEVDRINRVVRAKNKFNAEYNIGDKVIFTSPVYRELLGLSNLIFSASEIARVREVSSASINGYPCFNLRLRSRKNEAYVLVYDTSQMNYINFLQKDGVKSPDIVHIKYAYAITVHRSQGSEAEVVHVNLEDIRRCQEIAERRKLSYVAFSRASRALRILC